MWGLATAEIRHYLLQVHVAEEGGPVFLENVRSETPGQVAAVALHGAGASLLGAGKVGVGERFGGQGSQQARGVEYVVALVITRDHDPYRGVFDGANKTGVAFREETRIL